MDQSLDFQSPIMLSSDQLSAYAGAKLIDIYPTQLAELQRIYHLSPNTVPEEIIEPVYIYYPWHHKILKTIPKQQLDDLRTNRNKNLITDDEQQRLQKATVGIAGMSVGAGIAIGLAYSGMSDHIKIADHDTLETANLNRLRESLLAVNTPKVNLAAHHIYEINPYASVELFSEGLTAENIDNFFANPALSVVVDEIDDFKMKVQIRLKAKEQSIPVVMFTSLGDNILIDIERYDHDPDMPIFHGILSGVSEEILANPDISDQDIRRYSVQLVGQEYIPTKALASVAEMGKTLVGRPQLYSTIAVDGGLAPYVIRQIILNSEPASGRYFVKFGDLFHLTDSEFAQTEQRTAILERIFSRAN